MGYFFAAPGTPTPLGQQFFDFPRFVEAEKQKAVNSVSHNKLPVMLR